MTKIHKIFLSITLALIISLSLRIDISAYEPITVVRVGLESSYNKTEAVPFSDKQLSVGLELNGIFKEMVEYNSSFGFSVGYSNSYFAAINETAPSYEFMKMIADNYASYGYKGHPCLVNPDSWTVYFGPYATANEAQTIVSSLPVPAYIVNSTRLVTLSAGGAILSIFDSTGYYPQFNNRSGITILGSKKYRGSIECGRYQGQGITVVNVISLEEYLYSVVPSEMPSSWNLEALKAQSVAARTYVYTRKGAHSNQGYDVCDTTHCQVYLGAGNESVNTSLAVEATKGIIALYNGDPITASYFASSGGCTDDSENVWSQSMPYLRAVPDPYETTGKEWSRTYSLADIDAALSANKINIGSATGMKITEVSATGRVQKLVITGTAGSHTLTKENIRNFFSSLSGGPLESRNFTMADGVSASSPAQYYVSNGTITTSLALGGLSVYTADGDNGTLGSYTQNPMVASSTAVSQIQGNIVTTTSSGGMISIIGRGYGHGAGMSQHGANGMAAAGFTYDQILKHYYTGIELSVIK